MRILFAGTPPTAVPSLHELNREHEVLAVLTRAPAPVGRKQILTKSAVHDAADELGLPVHTPRTLKDSSVAELIANYSPDAIAVVAYGLLIPEPLLTVPKYGWLNLHFSLLPRWRGAAPVQFAIAAGDRTTGTSVFRIDAGLDTGPVLDVEEVPIPPDSTAGEFLQELSYSGAKQLSRVIATIGTLTARPQVGEVTHAPQIRSRDVKIDWTGPAESVANQIRGFTPAPGPWTLFGKQRVKIGPVNITDVAELAPGEISADDGLVGTGTTAVQLTTVAPAGKNWMKAADWLRGVKVANPMFDGGEHD